MVVKQLLKVSGIVRKDKGYEEPLVIQNPPERSFCPALVVPVGAKPPTSP